MKKLFTAIAVITIVFSCKKESGSGGGTKTVPAVNTAALTNVTSSSATAGGSIISNGNVTITQSGIVWSKTNAMPTLADSVVAGTTATGSFVSQLTGLEFNRTYYIRAFATNSVGTGYGNVVILNTTNDNTKVRFTYNGVEVEYGVFASPTTGKIWMDRNLGAQQAATAYNDYKAYGDLFQWGRPADGHQLFTWTSSTAGTPVNGTTSTKATSDSPGHSNFIVLEATAPEPWDWRSDHNMNRWFTNPQGPCPEGWHVPTVKEWRAEGHDVGSGGTAGGMMDRNDAYNQLKLVTPGWRNWDGQIFIGSSSGMSTGRTGYYWSSSREVTTIGFSDPESWEIGPSYVQQGYGIEVYGMSVRCIKN